MTTRESATRVSHPPKRRIRNFLLDPGFQLKYTAMVVVVTVAVASVLGYFAYTFSVAVSESLTAAMAMQPDLEPAVASSLEDMARERDRQVLLAIIAGIATLAIALGLTGIVITHKMAGPVFKMKRLLREVAAGDLSPKAGLRKGDELQDLFAAYNEMLNALRERERDALSTLAGVVDAKGEPSRIDFDKTRALRDRMRTSLGD